MLESLENNEQILLMYVAGELPAVDHQEVDQMLAGDVGLRRELERVREMYGAMANGLAALDRAEKLTPETMAVHRIGRAMRQQLRLRAAEAARKVRPGSTRLILPWWAYPSVAAAVLFIAFLTWVITFNFGSHHRSTLAEAPILPSFTTDTDSTPTTAPSTNPVVDLNSNQLAQEIESSFGPSTEKEDNQMFALSEDPQNAGGGDKND